MIDVIRRVLDATLLAGAHAATVAVQYGDGTVDLTPDESALRGRGMTGVRVSGATPEDFVRVRAGTRCLFEFVGGVPRVTEWAFEADSATLSFAADAKPVARDGDLVAADIVPAMSHTGMVLTPSPAVASALAAGTGSITTLPPLTPIVLTGVNASLKATLAASCKSVTL